jgi:hypothetical protein
VLFVIIGNACAISMMGSLGNPELDLQLVTAEYYFSLFFLIEFLIQVCICM